VKSRKHREEVPTGLEGVLIAAATPRRAQEYSIDLGATLELVDFLGESEARGIVLLASTGEFVHFALDDRRHMVNFAAKRSRLPLLANVSYSTLDGAVELAREAASAGVAGVFLMPPYYFRYSQESICGFYLAFAEALGDATPIYLCNTPVFTSGISASTAMQLLATGLFAGIEESGASPDDLESLAEQARQTPFTLLVGCERIYVHAKGLGANGVVSGIASAVPELVVALDKALRTGAGERIALLEARVVQFLDWTEQLPFPIGIKEAAKERKLKMGAAAAPLGEEGERKREAFREWFRGWLPDVLRECRP
jgi:dihydrodipicolinate synthase/N-acetylneuraminate lyase